MKDNRSKESSVEKAVETFLASLFALADLRSAGKTSPAKPDEITPGMQLFKQLWNHVRGWEIERISLISTDKISADMWQDKISGDNIVVIFATGHQPEIPVSFMRMAPLSDMKECCGEEILRRCSTRIREAA